jgi:hypothetical protein
MPDFQRLTKLIVKHALALKPRRNTRVDNHGGIPVHNQLRTHQKGREQTQGRWCC